ncbi:enoyl-CoA hydratase-related protein [Brevibacterium salitolerans]
MITQTHADGIVTLTIDNASKANALTAAMLEELVTAFEAASAEESVRGVLLTSAGGGGFSAGMDTAQFEHSSAVRAAATIAQLGRVCEAVKDCEAPVAVALTGYCVGGALEIAAAADFRVGGRSSWYSMPEVRIGIPSVLDAVNLHRVMGWTKASELILTGNRFSADDMDRCGFLNALVEDAETEERALGYLRDTMASDRAVIAQQKRLFRTWKNAFEREALADSQKEFALAFARRNG